MLNIFLRKIPQENPTIVYPYLQIYWPGWPSSGQTIYVNVVRFFLGNVRTIALANPLEESDDRAPLPINLLARLAFQWPVYRIQEMSLTFQGLYWNFQDIAWSFQENCPLASLLEMSMKSRLS